MILVSGERAYCGDYAPYNKSKHPKMRLKRVCFGFAEVRGFVLAPQRYAVWFTVRRGERVCFEVAQIKG